MLHLANRCILGMVWLGRASPATRDRSDSTTPTKQVEESMQEPALTWSSYVWEA